MLLQLYFDRSALENKQKILHHSTFLYVISININVLTQLHVASYSKWKEGRKHRQGTKQLD